jgi:two-component system response regulator CpxR
MLNQNRVIIDDIEILSDSREVYCGNTLIALTGLEFNLLWLLMTRSPELVSRESIAQLIFNRSIDESNSSINMHISAVRKKLLINTEHKRIKSLRGKGYIF